MGQGETYDSQIIKPSNLLDIPQRNLQFLNLHIHLLLRLLRAFHSLSFKSFNRLHLPGHIIRLRLEPLHMSFHLVDHGLVAQQGAVMVEIDSLRL